MLAAYLEHAWCRRRSNCSEDTYHLIYSLKYIIVYNIELPALGC